MGSSPNLYTLYMGVLFKSESFHEKGDSIIRDATKQTSLALLGDKAFISVIRPLWKLKRPIINLSAAMSSF